MAVKSIVFLALFAVARGSLVPVAKSADYTSFAYDVADPYTGDYKSQVETRSGDVVKGQYSLLESDGTKRTVDYSSDALNGFNAVVRKDPAVVAAPAAYSAPAVVASAPTAYASPIVAPAAYAAPIATPAKLSVAPAAIVAAAPAVYAAQSIAAPAAYAVRTIAAPAAVASSYTSRAVSSPVIAAVPAAYAARTISAPSIVAAPNVYAASAPAIIAARSYTPTLYKSAPYGSSLYW